MTFAVPPPDEATLNWVQEQIDAFRIVLTFAHDHGYSRLWRLETAAGFVWLKMHTYPHKWAGEVHALTRWTPTIGCAPRLIARRADPPAVLLAEVPGTAAHELELSPPAEARLWREAGAWISRLHARENDWFGNVREDGAPQDEPRTDAEAYLGRDWEEKFARGRATGLFDATELDFTEGAVRAGLPSLAGERPRAIHRDYTPRNWMAHPSGELTAVIDFEHARWDVRAADLDRPWDFEFLRNPDLIAPFLEGYGALSERDRAQITTLRTIKAFTTVVWATGVHDPEFAQRGRDTLHRLMGR